MLIRDLRRYKEGNALNIKVKITRHENLSPEEIADFLLLWNSAELTAKSRKKGRPEGKRSEGSPEEDILRTVMAMMLFVSKLVTYRNSERSRRDEDTLCDALAESFRVAGYKHLTTYSSVAAEMRDVRQVLRFNFLALRVGVSSLKDSFTAAFDQFARVVSSWAEASGPVVRK